MIHVVCGPPCAGKSTYVRENARDGDVIVDYDLIAQAFGCSEPHQSRRGPTGPNLAAFVARRAVIEWAVGHADEMESWVIHTNPLPEDMDAYESVGADIVTLDADMETCLARAEADGRPPGTEEAIREWFANRDEAPKGAFFMPAKGGSMETKFKSFDVKADAISEDGGTITGYASTWDREPDSYGDIVREGAFAKSLEKWAAKEARIPFLFGHRTDDPKYNIGWCEAEEDGFGLKFTAHLDADSDMAQYVRKLYKEGRIYQFSFAYSVIDAAPVELDDGVYACELRELDIYEISAVQIPANQHAEVVDVKDAPADGGVVNCPITFVGTCDRADMDAIAKAIAGYAEKAGRRNSRKDEDELKRISSLLSETQSIVNGLIGEEADAPDEQEPKADGAEAKSEEPDTANDEEPQAKEVEALLQQAEDLLDSKEG